MGFRFPLATLLRLREITEQREERLLAQILAQMAQGQQTLADLQVQRTKPSAQLESALQQSTSAFELQGLSAQIRQLNDLETAGKEHVAKLATLRVQQMKIYEAAHRDRVMISDIRQDQLANFERSRTRQEQNAMDDVFSSRKRLR